MASEPAAAVVAMATAATTANGGTDRTVVATTVAEKHLEVPRRTAATIPGDATEEADPAGDDHQSETAAVAVLRRVTRLRVRRAVRAAVPGVGTRTRLVLHG